MRFGREERDAIGRSPSLQASRPLPLRRLRTPPAVLLYGPAGSGKTLLTQAAAHEAGAALFDLSPAATRGKYPGKEAGLMVHMVSGHSVIC